MPTRKDYALLSPQDQLRSFPASVVACKATNIPSVDVTRSKRCDNGVCSGSNRTHTPYLERKGGRMWFMKQLIRLLGVVFQVDQECP